MVGSSGSIVRPPRRGRSVALTGACSFLGKNLIGMLEEDDTVARLIAIDVDKPETAGAKTHMYDVDLTLPTADERVAEILDAERVDTLLHLAFLSSPTHGSAWAHELESVGTMHLLNGARQAPPERLVLWSQTWLYGAKPHNPNFLVESAPLGAPEREPYFVDKIAAEREVGRYAEQHPETTVTVLRTAPIVGPTVNNYMIRYLSRPLLVKLLGFDPLWQFVHEIDAVAAFRIAIDRGRAGVFNVVGDGILPLSKVVRLVGRPAAPLPLPVARSVATMMWTGQLAPWPSSFLPYLRYLCVADGGRAAAELGFCPAYTTQEALMDFVSAQRLRDVRLAQQVEA
ncbi:MAG: NAD-dependent epimerase/dehydratase family protein [Deltaproteobacteria bacterium]|jgi:UDP-glucose 4-epimerase|nr:NAD-dependent epimerase/dehydratase family protein [Deltaproteobacteria bacterium]MBW2531835.1 NAD-dependent epimerase/dehydratase family protein [Deltaproteobacteria bacterium]